MGIESIRNIDHVVLLCERMDEMKKFYLETMKLPLHEDLGRWVSFRLGSGFLSLRQRGPFRAWHDGAVPKGTHAVQVAFRVPPHEIDACHKELAAKGVEIMCPPVDVPSHRHRALFFRDPEGNLLEIYAEL